MIRIYTYKDIIIEFDDNLFIDVLKNHQSDCKNETGGILCGYYDKCNQYARITQVCNPPKDSKFGFASFVRGIFGLKEQLKIEWEKGIYYLGDWHLHSFSSPNASKQDLKQLKINSEDKSLKCPEPLMIIIGTKNFELDFNTYLYIDNAIQLLEYIK